MRVIAIVPAHNEEKNIERLIYCLNFQTFAIEKIIVVADNCNDNTVDKVLGLQEKFANLFYVETKGNVYYRAGAMNAGLKLVDEKDCDILLVLDADTYIAEDLVENAIESFKKDPLLGGVCSTAHVLKPKENPASWIRKLEVKFLWVIQRLEYSGFDAERTATWKNVTILHGLCGAYRMKAIKEVKGYSLGRLLEDYDLTLKIKKAGWHAKFNPNMHAWTEVPITFKAFFRQRLRWIRGGVDILLSHGINKFTAEDAFHHLLFFVLFVSILVFVFFYSFYGEWGLKFNYHPIPITLAFVGYFLGLYKLRYLKDIKFSDVLVRVIILPELLVAMAMVGVRLHAYYLAIFGCPQKW